MELFLIIAGMSIVTVVPRLLPAIMMDRFVLPKSINRWLRSIPYAALGALIFPGILTIEKDTPLVGLVGGAVAIVAAFFRFHIMYVVFGSILSVIALKIWYY